jgi:uncharacterized small protein (DUF1192 family)
MDWDEPKAKSAQTFPRALAALGVADLRTYIKELQAEIARVECEIINRAQHESAAQSLFKQ